MNAGVDLHEIMLSVFVNEKFDAYDVNNNGYLSLEEFVQLYRAFLCSDPDDVVAKLKETHSELEELFLRFDADASFGLAMDEIVKLMRSKDGPGFPAPADEKLQEIAVSIFKKFDANKDMQLDFDE